jgi:hypothetical protein
MGYLLYIKIFILLILNLKSESTTSTIVAGKDPSFGSLAAKKLKSLNLLTTGQSRS